MSGEEESESESQEDPFLNPHFTNPSQYSLHNRLTFSHFDKNYVVFPPVDHEGLPPSPPAQTLVPASPPEECGGGSDVQRWAGLIRAKAVALLFRGLYRFRGGNRSFGFGAVGTVVVVVWWFYSWFRRRRRRRERLVDVIKEKDEKIKQLLHQIAQMNQLLLSLHNGAPSQGGAAT